MHAAARVPDAPARRCVLPAAARRRCFSPPPPPLPADNDGIIWPWDTYIGPSRVLRCACAALCCPGAAAAARRCAPSGTATHHQRPAAAPRRPAPPAARLPQARLWPHHQQPGCALHPRLVQLRKLPHHPARPCVRSSLPCVRTATAALRACRRRSSSSSRPACCFSSADARLPAAPAPCALHSRAPLAAAFLRIFIKNMHRTKHGSDSGARRGRRTRLLRRVTRGRRAAASALHTRPRHASPASPRGCLQSPTRLLTRTPMRLHPARTHTRPALQRCTTPRAASCLKSLRRSSVSSTGATREGSAGTTSRCGAATAAAAAMRWRACCSMRTAAGMRAAVLRGVGDVQCACSRSAAVLHSRQQASLHAQPCPSSHGGRA